RLFSATSSGPKTSCSLLSSRNGNHAAGFVGDECDDPVERGGASSSCTRRSNGKPRTRKMPTLRGLLLLLAVEGRSKRCGAYATAKPKRKVRSFEDIHFPHSG